MDNIIQGVDGGINSLQAGQFLMDLNFLLPQQRQDFLLHRSIGTSVYNEKGPASALLTGLLMFGNPYPSPSVINERCAGIDVHRASIRRAAKGPGAMGVDAPHCRRILGSKVLYIGKAVATIVPKIIVPASAVRIPGADVGRGNLQL